MSEKSGVLDFEFKRVTVIRLRHGGTDRIHFELIGPTPFPELDAESPGQYPPRFELVTRRGYAEQWLVSVGIEPTEVIDA